MLSKEENPMQRKRRSDSASSSNDSTNEAFEKKQRVEQLVGALARPGKKQFSSSSPVENNSDRKKEV